MSGGGLPARLWDNLRPLDPLRSIKMKIGILVVASIVAAALVFWVGTGSAPTGIFVTAVVVALLVTQLLAHGMTSPLRAMTAAARAMARGDYSRRVRATSRDEVGELGRAFNQMASDLAAVDRQRRELIANVSHELRTPISALRAVLENLVDGVTQPDQETLRAALARTERLGTLVADLLDLSRLDAGVVRLDCESFEVRRWLADVVHETETGSGERIALSVSPDDLTAYADPARLHQVLANLLDNAVRHGPPGEQVTVNASADTEGGLLLEVADRGPGIPFELREQVFERFTGGAGSGDDSRGTGLGLAIARWIVELHGGRISVLDGEGCRIQVHVPQGDQR